MTYKFYLKDNNVKAYMQFTWFLFFMHILAAVVFVLRATENRTRLSLYILLGFYAILIILYNSFRRRPKSLETLSLILALLYGNFWFQHVGILAVLVFAGIYILVSVVKGKRTSVVFLPAAIQLTRVFKTVIFQWSAIEHVVLKDDVLTIDFKTNKIIQVEIMQTDQEVDETEFNLFCTKQLSHTSR